MKKFKKLALTVVALAMVCALCMGLTGCGSTEAGAVAATDKSYTFQTASLSEYSAENPIPFKLGQGSGIFGFDGWILTGTKTPIDDDTGAATGCYWDVTLDVDDTVAAGLIEYVLTLHFHADPSSAYTQPVEAFYTFNGRGYEIEGGYHLFVPNTAEATITGQCMAETPGWRADTGEALTVKAADGTDLYYYYTNSDLQLAGYEFGFPLNGNLVASVFECDVLVSDGAITGFANVTETVSDLVIPSSGAGEGSGDAAGGDDAGSGDAPAEGENNG